MAAQPDPPDQHPPASKKVYPKVIRLSPEEIAAGDARREAREAEKYARVRRNLDANEVKAREIDADLDERTRDKIATERARAAIRQEKASIRRAAQVDEPDDSRANRAKITVSTDQHRVVLEAEGALATSGQDVYQRAGLLVKVRRAHGMPGRSDNPPVTVDPIHVDHLGELVSASARWVAVREGRDGPEEKPCSPPTWCVRALANRKEWPTIPVLTAVVEAPCLRPDGSILAAHGYDAATGIYLDAGCDVEPVPEMPTRDQACAALDELRFPLSDFPFVEDSDRAACLAAILTPLARNMVGSCPLFAVRAPTAGSGKSLVAHLVSRVTTGRDAAIMTATGDADEERKRILSIALGGEPVALIDNVERPLGSEALAAALTGSMLTDRLLGSNIMARVPLNAVWFATGNNLVVRGDLGRRVVPIDLDAKVERPETRGGWKIGGEDELKEWVGAHRAGLARAGLTVLRAYITRDKSGEASELEKFGSFGRWSELVRGALVWAGEADPCGGRERMRGDSDTDFQAARDLLEAWHEAFGPVDRTLAEAIAEAGRKPVLHAALAALDPKSGDKLDARRLGFALRRLRGRIVAGFRLEQGERQASGMSWKVVPEGKKADSAPAAGEPVPGTGGNQEPPPEPVVPCFGCAVLVRGAPGQVVYCAACVAASPILAQVNAQHAEGGP